MVRLDCWLSRQCTCPGRQKVEWLALPVPGFSTGRRFARRWCCTVSSTRRQRSEEHTSELQSHSDLVCRLLLEKKKKKSHPIRVSKDRVPSWRFIDPGFTLSRRFEVLVAGSTCAHIGGGCEGRTGSRTQMRRE